MTEPVIPYRVSYSDYVLQRLRALGNEATQRGDGPQFAAALKEFDRRLRIFPQFGEPCMDLTAVSGQIYKGFVRPLAMKYAVHEDRRLVLVGELPVLLPMERPQPDDNSETPPAV